MHYPRSTHYIAALLRRSLPHVAAWPAESVLQWVQWHANHGLVLAVRKGWRILSVVLYRRVWSREQAEGYYDHDPMAPVAYIDAAVARQRGGTRALFVHFFNHVGRSCAAMLWSRFKHGNRPVLLPMPDAMKRFGYE